MTVRRPPCPDEFPRRLSESYSCPTAILGPLGLPWRRARHHRGLQRVESKDCLDGLRQRPIQLSAVSGRASGAKGFGLDADVRRRALTRPVHPPQKAHEVVSVMKVLNDQGADVAAGRVAQSFRERLSPSDSLEPTYRAWIGRIAGTGCCRLLMLNFLPRLAWAKMHGLQTGKVRLASAQITSAISNSAGLSCCI